MPSDLVERIIAQAGGHCQCHLSSCPHGGEPCGHPLVPEERGRSWGLVWGESADGIADVRIWLALCRDCLPQWPQKRVMQSLQVVSQILSGKLQEMPVPQADA